jgi:hypothetical protein
MERMQLVYHLGTITMHTIVADTMKEGGIDPFESHSSSILWLFFFIIQFASLLV